MAVVSKVAAGVLSWCDLATVFEAEWAGGRGAVVAGEKRSFRRQP